MRRAERESRPQGRHPEPAQRVSTAISTRTTVAQAVDHLTHFQRVIVIDSMLDGWSVYCERRARECENARPVPGDFVGKATRADLSDQWQRLTAIAAAWRAKAQTAPLVPITQDVEALDGEALCLG